MQSFIAKDDRVIFPEPHEATFRGDHNKAKAKALILLADRVNRGITTGLSVREIHLATGVDYRYLCSRLSFWVKWKYLDRKVAAPAASRPYYTYTIAKRGIHFVKDRIPKARVTDYIRGINAFRAKNNPKKKW